MEIVQDIFYKSDNHYTAKYGWQEELGEGLYTFGYIFSYKEAANDLVDKMIPDLYIFPIMFCYRQYLELVLKNICYRCMERKEYKTFIYKYSHDLGQVWNQAFLFIKDYINDQQMQEINMVVNIFNKIDSKSFTFRFEFKHNLERSIEGQLNINTFELRKWIDKVDSYLYFTYGN